MLSQALIHGLGRHYYSLPINYRKNELEYKVTYTHYDAYMYTWIDAVIYT